jgi:hypothetical protein
LAEVEEDRFWEDEIKEVGDQEKVAFQSLRAAG